LEIAAADKKIKDPTTDPYPELLRYIDVIRVNYEYHNPVGEDALSPSATMILLKITPLDPSEASIAFDRVVRQLHFRVTYTSMYRARKKYAKTDGFPDSRLVA
jgi:hypothetical protein